MPAAARLGYFGKLPGHGDFVRAGLSEESVAAWDGWVRAGMIESRAMLGEGWLAAFLEAPVWAFGIAPGLCGGAGLAGVMAPSVDAAGRYFPLMIAAAVADPPEPEQSHAWFATLAIAAADAVHEAWTQARLGAAITSAGPPPCVTGQMRGCVFATDGAPRVARCARRFATLPPADAFAALLTDAAVP